MAPLPTFTIVVPTFGRASQLGQCLRALACLDYPRDLFEVIVVDDGSTPPLSVVTPSIADLGVTLMTQTHRGPAAARNAGAARAQGAFLAFTDDDCTPDRNWLSALEAGVTHSPDSAVGGRTENLLAGNPWSTASQMLISYLYAYYNPARPTFFASNNLAVPTHLFREIGGFDTEYMLGAGEDREFCYRWLHGGYTMAYTPDAVVNHAHPLTLRSFWRQHLNYGRGAFQFHLLRARRGQSRVKFEPPGFYLGLFGYPFQQSAGRRAARLALLLVLSQIANAAGFAREAMSGSIKEL